MASGTALIRLTSSYISTVLEKARFTRSGYLSTEQLALEVLLLLLDVGLLDGQQLQVPLQLLQSPVQVLGLLLRINK